MFIQVELFFFKKRLFTQDNIEIAKASSHDIFYKLYIVYSNCINELNANTRNYLLKLNF
jgi:hypothetical protein